MPVEDPTIQNPAATTPAPTVVTSQPAETAVAGAQNNINQFNQNATPPTPSSSGTPPTSNGGTGSTSAPTGTDSNGNPSTPNGSPVNSGSPNLQAFTDPETGQTTYYNVNSDGSTGSVVTDPGVIAAAGVAGVTIPTPTPASNYNDPNDPSANIDANGYITGTGVPAAVALGSTQDVNDINAQLQASNAAITASGASSVAAFQAMQNGTIQLTPAQQSMIGNMTTLMGNLITLQSKANASYVGSIMEASTRGEAGTPANSMAMVAQASQNAAITLSTIAATQGAAIAQATDAAQNEDYQAMITANENYQDTLKQQQSTLENLSSQVQQSIVDARNFNETVTQNTFQNNMASATLSLQQKQNLYQNYISSQDLTLAQKTEAETIYNDAQTIAVAKLNAGAALESAAASAESANVAQETYAATFGDANLWGNPYGGGAAATGATVATAPTNSDGSTPQNVSGWHYSPQTGQFLDGNGNPITGAALTALQNSMSGAGLQAFNDGVAYFDPSRIPNANAQQGASTMAGEKNIPTLDSNDASAINNAEQAKKELTQMYTYWIGTQPASTLTGQLAAAAQKLGSNMNPTPESIAANQAAYNSSKSALYQMLSSLSQSKRANGGEYEVGTEAAPTANNAFGFNTLQATGQAEFGAINANINALIGGVLPQVTVQSDPIFQSSDDLINTLAPLQAGSTPATSSASSGFGAMYQ